MKTVTTIKECRTVIERWRCNKKKIGFVPTMGALHDGHLALIREAKKQCDKVVVTIFVNPTQFGPDEDYEDYPRELKKDSKLLTNEKADLLFLPGKEELYPEGFATQVVVSDRLTQTMCGLIRPGHFTGVATIVTKLLNCVKAHVAFFGQKDYQQTIIVKRLSEDLNTGTQIIVCPTVRESDGLAKSSRNSYLSDDERRAAPAVYQALKLAEGMLQVGERNPESLKEAVKKRLKSEPNMEIEYIEAKNAETLEDLNILSGKVLVAVAVKLGKARLIDNIVTEVASGS